MGGRRIRAMRVTYDTAWDVGGLCAFCIRGEVRYCCNVGCEARYCAECNLPWSAYCVRCVEEAARGP